MRGTLPTHARAVMDYVSAHPRRGWFISDLLPDASKALPSGYPRDRRSLDRSLDTLVARGHALREAFDWASQRRILKAGGRNPTYVYHFPSILPVKEMSLQIWLAADPTNADQTHNLRHWLPRKHGTP